MQGVFGRYLDPQGRNNIPLWYILREKKMSEDNKCGFCKVIKDRHNKIYEDDLVFAFAADQPAGAGHVIVIPKEHHLIFEELPDDVAGHIFFIANKISIAVFESLGAHGTNIIINNGTGAGQQIAHCALHILPRRENDGLDFAWPANEASEDDLGTAELFIKEQTRQVGIFEREQAEPVEMTDKHTEVIEEPKVDDKGSKEENYLVKQLRRMP